MNITFSSIEFPGGENVAIDAVAADMSLQAIKGNVTGKQAGRSMLVRSLRRDRRDRCDDCRRSERKWSSSAKTIYYECA